MIIVSDASPLINLAHMLVQALRQDLDAGEAEAMALAVAGVLSTMIWWMSIVAGTPMSRHTPVVGVHPIGIDETRVESGVNRATVRIAAIGSPPSPPTLGGTVGC